MSRLATAALAYARKGWRVLPLHEMVDGVCSCRAATCSNPAKHPRTRHGHHEATTDATTVARWWAQWPTANIGMTPGPTALVVLDFDSLAAEEAGAHLGLFAEPTLEVTTARGCHRYYQHPGFHVGNLAPGAIAPGIDVRGDAGYVVVPPSVHATGVVYRWRQRGIPAAALPPKVLELLRRAPRTGTIVGHVGPIPEGQRNVTLNAIACAMRRKGCGDHAIARALHIENEDRCRPPLDPREVDALVASSAGVLAKAAGTPARRLVGSWGRA